jgi:hypothetical protein
VFGIGPVIAALVIGDIEDIAQFASRDASPLIWTTCSNC